MKKPTNPEELKLARKIGKKVKDLRDKLDLTQEELAIRAKIKDYKVVGVCKNKRLPFLH